VKHHIERLKNDKLTRSESDSLQSVQTISSSANCSAGEPSVMNDAKADEIPPAFLGSKHIKLRYFKCKFLFYVFFFFLHRFTIYLNL